MSEVGAFWSKVSMFSLNQDKVYPLMMLNSSIFKIWLPAQE